MSRRYSASDREMAAVFCAIKASNRSGGVWSSASDDDIVQALGVSASADDLAGRAFFASWTLGRALDMRIEWAEAEALIRTGWVPS